MQYDFGFCLREGRRMRNEGRSAEEVLRFFRENGATMIESIKLLRALEVIDLGEAKRIVHFSEAWKDLREGSEQLHEEAEKAAMELGKEAGVDDTGDEAGRTEPGH